MRVRACVCMCVSLPTMTEKLIKVKVNRGMEFVSYSHNTKMFILT